MRIVVLGGSGLIGKRLVDILQAKGHKVVAASRSTGVDAIAGVGLADALSAADVLVDVANTPSEDHAALEFFTRLTSNLLAAERAANIGHHVMLSIVGVDRVASGSYFRAKKAQEDLVRAASLPYTIVRSTQFFELIERILSLGDEGVVVRMPSAWVQPVASDDVAELLAEVAVAPPQNGTIEMAGLETIRLDELARLLLAAHEDPRNVVEDANARFFGAMLRDKSLILGPEPRFGQSALRDWLRRYITPD